MTDKILTPIEKELEAITSSRAAVSRRISEAEAARKAAVEDPAVVLAEAKIAFAREKRQADAAEHELAADAAYRDACLSLGDDRVARVRTRYGSIVFRAQSELEIDAAEARSASHRPPPSATPAEKLKSEGDVQTALRIGLRGAVLTDRDHFDRVTSANVGLWKAIWAARNALIDARILDEGKGDAH